MLRAALAVWFVTPGGMAGAAVLMESRPSQWFEHRAENAWLTPYDPTLIGRRILAEFN